MTINSALFDSDAHYRGTEAPFLLPPKPFKSYPQLVEHLKSKGMIIKDEERAIRKISQIGYYRLSGFWHPYRIPEVDSCGKNILNPVTEVPQRFDWFCEGTDFDNVITLYKFDKKLRILLIDAIERIEIHIRSVIAHELGKFDPAAYKKETFIDQKYLKDHEVKGEIKNSWGDWSKRCKSIMCRSTDAHIAWHNACYTEIPFWVVVETWDFGLMSNYYNILGDKHKDLICKRVGVPNKKTLNNWLKEINFIRNKCAHHSRVWNIRLNSALNTKGLEEDPYFKMLSLDKTYNRKKMYGIISVLWFLVKKIGRNSEWILNVADLIDSLPNCDSIQYYAMGFPDENGFPRNKFGLPPKTVDLSPIAPY